MNWENKEINFNVRYQLLNDCWVYAGVMKSESSGVTARLDQYSMPYYKGKKTTISLGANIGF